MYLSCTKVSVIQAYFTYFTFPWVVFTKLPCSVQSYHIFLSLHDTYTIIMYCDYAGSVYGTTPVCNKRVHIYTVIVQKLIFTANMHHSCTLQFTCTQL